MSKEGSALLIMIFVTLAATCIALVQLGSYFGLDLPALVGELLK